MKPKQKTIHISFTRDNDYLYDQVMEQCKDTGIKMSTVVCLALKEYYANK